MTSEDRVTDQIEGWAGADGPRTLGSLVELFEEKGFAALFVLLLSIGARQGGVHRRDRAVLHAGRVIAQEPGSRSASIGTDSSDGDLRASDMVAR